MLWHECKQAIHAQKPCNVAKKSWPKFLQSSVKDSLPVTANACVTNMQKIINQEGGKKVYFSISL